MIGFVKENHYDTQDKTALAGRYIDFLQKVVKTEIILMYNSSMIFESADRKAVTCREAIRDTSCSGKLL